MTFEHVFADLGGVPTGRLADPQALSGLLLSAANAAGMNPAGPPTVLTGPQGVAAVLMCHGGHVALHAVLAGGMGGVCFADVAGLAPAHPQRGLDVIIKRLGAQQVRTDARRRGPVLPTPTSTRSEEAS